MPHFGSLAVYRMARSLAGYDVNKAFAMIVHFVKVIFRYLTRKMFFTCLNIAGLAIGLASCIVIYLFAVNEVSYDQFHRDSNRLYRVLRQSSINGMPYNIGVTAAPFAPALQQDFSGHIEATTRALPFSSLFTYEDKSFLEEELLLADSNFFEVFSYPLYRGDPSSVLRTGNGIVISKSLSEKYFGSEEPVGKIIRLDDQYDMIVTGVLDDLPGNTHLRFDAVGSINIAEEEDWYSDWWGNAFYTYVKLYHQADPTVLKKAFPEFMEKYFGDDFQRQGSKVGLTLESLQDIYFNNDTRYENNVMHGDRRHVFIFGSVGILLLLLAAINYINLATAQASSRAKEVGIRKTLGSGKGTVAFQFLAESLLLAVLSMVLAICIAQFTIPILNAHLGLSIPGVSAMTHLWIFALVLLLVITVAAGAYPAFLLSSFKPTKVLKGDIRGDLRYVFVRKGLVIIQFGISGFMIICTLLIGSQLRFMQEKDLGFQADQLIVVRLNNGLINRERVSFRESLLKHNAFSNASLITGYPGGFYDATTVQIQGEDEAIRMRTLWTDPDYLETMELKMVAGRFFSHDIPADSASSVILNETAVRQLGWKTEEALGRRVMMTLFDSVYKEVIGVVEDYHFSSLRENIEPLIISNLDTRGNLLVRMSGVNIPAAVQQLERVWGSYDTGFPLDFVFLDDVMDRLYTREVVQGKIFSLFSVISLIIASLGILGLTSFMASQRKKEIGVRKVLGATTRQVSVLLMKDLLMLVLIANIIAVPVGYWAMESWLQGFAYRVSLNAPIFIIGSLFVFVVATVIVGLNASRIALQNPVHSLRSE